jgi:hypothetical protein
MDIIDGLKQILKRMRAGRDVVGEVEDFWKASHMTLRVERDFKKDSDMDVLRLGLSLELAKKIRPHIVVKKSLQYGEDDSKEYQLYHAYIEIASELGALDYVRREEDNDRYRREKAFRFVNGSELRFAADAQRTSRLRGDRVVEIHNPSGPNANGDVFTGFTPLVDITDAPPIAGHWTPMKSVTTESGPALPPPKEDK